MSSVLTPPLNAHAPRQSRWDVILGGLFVVLGCVGLRIANDGDFWSRWLLWDAPALAVGKTTRVSGGVRVKGADATAWRDVGREAIAVASGDQVFTGSDGQAELTIDNAARTIVSPNSLVVVEAQGTEHRGSMSGLVRQFFGARKEASVLNVRNGRVSVRLGSGETPVVVQIKNRRFEISSLQSGIADVTGDAISARDIQVDVRELGVAGVPAIPRLEQGEELRVGNTDAAPVVTQARPSASETLLQAAPLVPPQQLGPVTQSDVPLQVALTWHPVPASLSTEIEYAPASAPHEARTALAYAGGFDLKLETEGEYSWRVRTLDAQGKKSAWSPTRFLRATRGHKGSQLVSGLSSVALPAPLPPVARTARVKTQTQTPLIEILPTLENDAANASTRLSKDSALDSIPVRLAWKPLEGVSNYHVTVFNTDGSIFRQGPTNGSAYVVMLRSLAADQYRYRVEATLPNGQKVQSRLVPVRVMMSPPVARLPAMNAQLAAGDDVLMTWEKTAITESYALEIARTADFKKSEVSVRQAANFYKFKPSGVGTYHWRVKSLSGGRESTWSAIGVFSIQ